MSTRRPTMQKTTDHDINEDLGRPFSTWEIVRMFLFASIVYPIGLAIMILPGAYLRCYLTSSSVLSFEDLWYGFWLTIIGIPIISSICLVALLDRPRLVRKRMNKVLPGKTESIDERRFHFYTTILYIGGMILASYDASGSSNKGRKESFPKLYNWIGLLLIGMAMIFIVWVFRCNPYASRVVHVQPDQRLVTTGPYSIVRHPMYMAMIPAFCGLPLCVGSIAGISPMVICCVLVGIRTIDEERFLVRTFGRKYQDYQNHVPYKMIPWVY